MMTNYYERAKKARTKTTTPTLTDQSSAHETDINVIVRRFLSTRTIGGNNKQPMGGDFTSVPDNLRDLIDLTRQQRALWAKLPDALKALDPGRLVQMTPAEVNAILQPPKPSGEQPKDEPK